MISKPVKKIALICTGSRGAPGEAEKVQQVLSQKNYDVVFGKDCTQWLAPQKRAEIFLQYLRQDDIDCLWLLRGGEGSADVLPYLHMHHKEITQLPQKLLLGFSDFTPFLIYFAQCYGWQTVHGMGALQLIQNKLNAESFEKTFALLEGSRTYHIDALTPLNPIAQQMAPTTASCIGGTLSLLNISVKDLWELNSKDKIVVIEDVNEKGYQVDRTLKYLKRVGCFAGAKALIFGDFACQPIGCDAALQAKQHQYLMQCLDHFAKSCEFAVFHTVKIGHGKINFPIIFNRQATLSDQVLSFS